MTTGGPQGKHGGLRRRSRHAALALLYQSDMGVHNFQEHVDHYFANNRLPEKAKDFADKLIIGVMDKRDSLDAAISEVSAHWRLDRMNVIDRNILRIAAYEILFVPDVPRNVSINEAIEIGKTFGTEDSGAFINGILDRFHKPDSASEGESESVPNEEPEVG